MKKYMKPEIAFTLLMEDLSICAGSPTVDHSASHGNDGTDEHGNGDWYNQGQESPAPGTYTVEDDTEGNNDSFSKSQSIWSEW